MAATLPSLSASVTRILSLTGFPPELKTKDIQSAFSEWDALSGGFKIKWVDDTSLLLVFNDANVAKRAYLQTILSPHPSLTSPTSALTLSIKPYDGPDAQSVIYTVNTRRNNPSRASISGAIPNPGMPGNGGGAHARGLSTASNNGGAAGTPRASAWKSPNNNAPVIPASGLSGSMHAPSGSSPERTDGSPPTSSLDPTTLTSNSTPTEAPSPRGTPGPESTPPRVGDPGRRMVGAALGVKHPGLAPKASPARGMDEMGNDLRGLNKAMGGIVITE